MDTNEQISPKPATARRRLLRGAFSVPAVMAVHNGSALAASSNKLNCALKITNGTPILPVSVTTADGYVRVSRYQTVVFTVTRKWIKVSDLQAVATVAGLPFVSPTGTNTGWVEYLVGGTYVFGSPPITPTVTTSLVAVLFDSNGSAPNFIRVVGFRQSGQTTAPAKTSAVTGSCWTSLQP